MWIPTLVVLLYGNFHLYQYWSRLVATQLALCWCFVHQLAVMLLRHTCTHCSWPLQLVLVVTFLHAACTVWWVYVRTYVDAVQHMLHMLYLIKHLRLRIHWYIVVSHTSTFVTASMVPHLFSHAQAKCEFPLLSVICIYSRGYKHSRLSRQRAANGYRHFAPTLAVTKWPPQRPYLYL